jgi:hypothetical protein
MANTQKAQKVIHYDVGIDVHDALTELFARMDADTITKILQSEFKGEKFTPEEIETKFELLFLFYKQLEYKDLQIYGEERYPDNVINIYQDNLQ